MSKDTIGYGDEDDMGLRDMTKEMHDHYYYTQSPPYSISSAGASALNVSAVTTNNDTLLSLSEEDSIILREIIEKAKFDKTIEGKLEKLGFTDESEG